MLTDVKTYLFDVSNYSNAYFETARTTGQYAGQYRMLEQEWWSQRYLGIDLPIATLQAAGHPLYNVRPSFWDICAITAHFGLFQLIMDELAVLDVIAPTPAASGYTQAQDTSEVSKSRLLQLTDFAADIYCWRLYDRIRSPKRIHHNVDGLRC